MVRGLFVLSRVNARGEEEHLTVSVSAPSARDGGEVCVLLRTDVDPHKIHRRTAPLSSVAALDLPNAWDVVLDWAARWSATETESEPWELPPSEDPPDDWGIE